MSLVRDAEKVKPQRSPRAGGKLRGQSGSRKAASPASVRDLPNAEALKFLWAYAPHAPKDLVAIDPAKKTVIDSHRFEGDSKALNAWLKRHNGKHGLYFHAATLAHKPTKHKAIKADVGEVPYLFVDCDVSEGEDLAAGKSRILADLQRYTPAPSIVVDTGNGCQAFWELDEPKAIRSAADRDDVENRLAHLVLRLRGDPSRVDVSSVMRLPGTLNIPGAAKIAKGRTPVPSGLIHVNSDRVYGIDKFIANTLIKHHSPKGPKPSVEALEVLLPVITEALHKIPASCDRTTWRNAAWAIQSFSGKESAYFELVDAWSKGSKEKYSKDELAKLWESEGDGIGIVTLFHYAREHGYTCALLSVMDSSPASILDEDNVAVCVMLEAYIPTEWNKLATLIKGRRAGLTELKKRMKAASRDLLGADSSKRSVADLIVDLASEAKLYKCDYVAIASMKGNGHTENYKIKSTAFRRYLNSQYLETYGRSAGERELKQAQATLDAKAIHSGEEVAVHLRTAEYEGKHYIDMCNDAREVIEISKDSISVTKQCPVIFMRNPGMLELPAPDMKGTIDEGLQRLRELYSIYDEGDFKLLVSWILMSMNPNGAYPLLGFVGPSGSAKTTASKQTKQLTDPNKVSTGRPPKNSDDLYIRASKQKTLVLENISGLSAEMSDDLCSIATGTGYAKRELFTDDEEFSTYVQKPIICNGIGDFIRRPDLLDRAIVIALPGRDEWSEERIFADRFEAFHPAILGALLRVYKHGLEGVDSIPALQPFRMAAFARWSKACEGAYTSNVSFEDAYRANKLSLVEARTEGDPVTAAIFRILQGNDNSLEGTATELLSRIKSDLSNTCGDFEVIPGIPKDPTRLSVWLNDNSPNLRVLGISFSTHRRKLTLKLSRGALEVA